MTGSISVYASHEDDSVALDEAGVKVSLISAGKYKTCERATATGLESAGPGSCSNAKWVLSG